jgi:predicted double-glycine peptidase
MRHIFGLVAQESNNKIHYLKTPDILNSNVHTRDEACQFISGEGSEYKDVDTGNVFHVLHDHPGV